MTTTSHPHQLNTWTFFIYLLEMYLYVILYCVAQKEPKLNSLVIYHSSVNNLSLCLCLKFKDSDKSNIVLSRLFTHLLRDPEVSPWSPVTMKTNPLCCFHNNFITLRRSPLSQSPNNFLKPYAFSNGG